MVSFNRRENSHVMEVITLMKGEWSYYIDVASLKKGEWSCYGGHFNGERMVMLWRWPVQWREHVHVTEEVSIMEREWSCYRSGQFK